MFDTRPVKAKHLVRGDSFRFRGHIAVVQSVEKQLVGSNVTVTYRNADATDLTCYIVTFRKTKKFRIYK